MDMSQFKKSEIEFIKDTERTENCTFLGCMESDYEFAFRDNDTSELITRISPKYYYEMEQNMNNIEAQRHEEYLRQYLEKIAEYGAICNHDDDYICSQRLLAILEVLWKLGLISITSRQVEKISSLLEEHDPYVTIHNSSVENAMDYVDYEMEQKL